MTPKQREGYAILARSFAHGVLDATHGTLLAPAEREAIIAALRHCQGMGHPLPLTEAELDALCKRLGEPQ